MSETTDPTAQGQQTPADNGDNSSAGEGQQAQQQFAGFEKRINELTAKFRGAEESIAQKDAQLSEMVRTVSELAMRQQAPVAAEPPVEIDPEERRRLEAILTPYQKRMEQMMANLESQVAVREVQTVAAQFGDERLQSRALQLMDAWKKQGFTGWQPRDAVRYAAGELYEADKLKSASGQNEQQRFNQLGNNMLTGQSAPPASIASNGALPTNFDSLPNDKQLEILERRLQGKTF